MTLRPQLISPGWRSFAVQINRKCATQNGHANGLASRRIKKTMFTDRDLVLHSEQVAANTLHPVYDEKPTNQDLKLKGLRSLLHGFVDRSKRRAAVTDNPPNARYLLRCLIAGFITGTALPTGLIALL